MANINPGAPKQQFDWQNPNQATFDFGRVLGRSFTGVFANLKPLAIVWLLVPHFSSPFGFSWLWYKHLMQNLRNHHYSQPL